MLITIYGTNDAPVITSAPQSGAVEEDLTLKASGMVTSIDADHGATATYIGDATGTYGNFAINAGTGEWTYALDNAASQNLAAGESLTETFTVTVMDDQGVTANQDVLITIYGTNDAPVITNNSGAMMISDGGILALGGTINNSGTITLASTGSETRLEALVESLTLQGGGQVTLSDNYGNIIFGCTASATLHNVDNTISGAGQLGAGQMTLINDGTIIADATQALTIDTGSNLITNSGVLEATGKGGLVIASPLDNSGHLWANGGNLSLNGDVTGAGYATISGNSTLEFGGASSINTTFAADGDGILWLDQASNFTGVISGFNQGDSLDLRDVSFGGGTGTTLSYDANQAGTGGLLTISNGVNTAHITLEGQYTTAGFAGASDQGSGCMVSYDAVNAARNFDQLVLGGNGKDILSGGSGVDLLSGGQGVDTFTFLAASPAS